MESWKFFNRDEMNLYETYEMMIYYRNIAVFRIYRFEQDVAVIFFGWNKKIYVARLFRNPNN